MSTNSEPVVTQADAGATTELNPRRWLALAVIAVAQLMVILDASIVNIALPSAQHDLNISDADRQWVITAYALTFGGLLLLGGRIADYVGRKKIFIVGLLGFAVASALGGAANTQELLFAARALQGVFAALLAPAALSLITVTFTEPKERASAFGVYGAVSGGGAAIGLILGGLLTEYASWRWCLLVNVPFGIATALAALPVVKESKAHGNTKYDIPGAVLVTGGLMAIVYGFTEAAKPENGWSGSTTLTLLIGGVALLVAFAFVELRSANPLLPVRVVWNRNRGGSFLASLLASAGLFAMFLFLVYYFQQNLGYSPIKSGVAFLPFTAGIIFSAGLASNLLPKVGPKPLMLVGTAFGAIGMLYLVRLDLDSSYAAVALPSQLLISVGLGLAFVSWSDLALHGVADHDAGVASALVNTTQQVGQALGIALLNTLYASKVVDYVGEHSGPGTNPADVMNLATIEGYHVAFLVGSIFVAAAFVGVFLLLKIDRTELARPEGAPAPSATPAETTPETPADVTSGTPADAV
jgi:EmrB/QacA subfamily drug resistance transporter